MFSPKIERILGWAVVLLLLLGCLLVLRPFVSALLWAVVLFISSVGRFTSVCSAGSATGATLAALMMTLAMILIVLLPFIIVAMTLADNIKELTGAMRSWIEAGPPAPPEWLAKIPVIGQKAVDYWLSMAADTAKLWTEAQRLIEPASSWLLRGGLALGGGLIQLAFSIFIAFFLFRDGVAVAGRLNHVVERIGGERGKHLLTGVAGKTVLRRRLWHFGNGIGTGGGGGHRFSHRRRARGRAAGIADFFLLHCAGRGDGADLAARRHLGCFYPGLDGLEPCFMLVWGLAWPTLITSSNRGSSVRAVDRMPFILIFLRRARRRVDVRLHHGVFLGPTFPGRRLPAAGGMESGRPLRRRRNQKSGTEIRVAAPGIVLSIPSAKTLRNRKP